LFKGNGSKQKKREEAFCLTAIVILIFAASTLCPWEKIASYIPPISSFYNAIQFPWRFNALTAVFAAWLLCLLGNKLTQARQKYVIIGIVVISVLQAADFTSKIMVEERPIFMAEIPDYRFNIMNAEYLPAGTERSDYNRFEITGEALSVHELSRVYNKLTYSLTNNSNDSDFIEVPLINYPGYRAIDANTGTRLKVSDGNSKSVKVEIPGNYSGTFTVRFVSPWYWRVAEAISLLTLLALSSYLIYNAKRNPIRNNS
jgi:hypothetical protein